MKEKTKTALQLVVQFKANYLLQTYPKMSMEKALEVASMRLYHEKMNALHKVLTNDLQGYFGTNYNVNDCRYVISDDYLKEYYQ